MMIQDEQKKHGKRLCDGDLKGGTAHPTEITLRFFHGWPETQVHGPKDDQTPSELKRIEYSFDHGGDGIERTIHLPEPFLKFFRSHSFRPKDDRGHIVLRHILRTKPSLLLQPLIDSGSRERSEDGKKGSVDPVLLGKG